MKPMVFWTIPCWRQQTKPPLEVIRHLADELCTRCLAHGFCPHSITWLRRHALGEGFAVQILIQEKPAAKAEGAS